MGSSTTRISVSVHYCFWRVRIVDAAISQLWLDGRIRTRAQVHMTFWLTLSRCPRQGAKPALTLATYWMFLNATLSLRLLYNQCHFNPSPSCLRSPSAACNTKNGNILRGVFLSKGFKLNTVSLWPDVMLNQTLKQNREETRWDVPYDTSVHQADVQICHSVFILHISCFFFWQPKSLIFFPSWLDILVVYI